MQSDNREMAGPAVAGPDESVRIVPATQADVPLILHFIRRLAEYERLPHEVVATEDGLRESLFGERPAAEVVFAWVGSEPAGFALFCHNYSTFLGRPGIWLEDLFVKPRWRSCGVGSRLLRHVARLAVERRCGRLEWSVLDWNELAIRFYAGLGAVPMDGWTVHRLTGRALEEVGAAEADGP